MVSPWDQRRPQSDHCQWLYEALHLQHSIVHFVTHLRQIPRPHLGLRGIEPIKDLTPWLGVDEGQRREILVIQGELMLKAEPVGKSSQFLTEYSCLLQFRLSYSTFQFLRLRWPRSLLNYLASFSWIFCIKVYLHFVWVHFAQSLKFLPQLLFVVWHQMTIFGASTAYKNSKKTTKILRRPHPRVFSWTPSPESSTHSYSKQQSGKLGCGAPWQFSQDAPASYNCSCWWTNAASPHHCPTMERPSGWTTDLHPGSPTLLLSTTERDTRLSPKA